MPCNASCKVSLSLAVNEWAVEESTVATEAALNKATSGGNLLPRG